MRKTILIAALFLGLLLFTLYLRGADSQVGLDLSSSALLSENSFKQTSVKLESERAAPALAVQQSSRASLEPALIPQVKEAGSESEKESSALSPISAPQLAGKQTTDFISQTPGFTQAGRNSVSAKTPSIAPLDKNLEQSLSSFQQIEQLYQGGQLPLAAASTSSAETELPLAEVKRPYEAILKNIPAPELSALLVSKGQTPPGLALDLKERKLSGHAKEEGIYRFTILAKYSLNSESEFAYRLSVRKSLNETAGELGILSNQLEVAQLGLNYTAQLIARGGKPPYLWQIEGLPKGLELDSLAGIISGSPIEIGTYKLSVLLTDSDKQSAASELELIVRSTPLFIVTHKLEEGQLGKYYQSRLSAQGGVPPYKWLIQGSLPAGLALDSASQVIRGEPQESFNGNLRLQVSDQEAKTDAADLSLIIANSDLKILTRALSEGFVGENYAVTLEAEGGTAPYSWGLLNSKLLPGLSLSEAGVISGRALESGESTINLRLKDANNQEALQTLQLRIVPPEASQPTTPDDNPPASPEPGDNPSSNPGSGDEGAPKTITNFKATGSSNKIGLSWTLSQAEQVSEIRVLRHNERFPANLEDGELVYQGLSTNFLDEQVINGQTYFYTAFSLTTDGSVSQPDSDSQSSARAQEISINSKPDPYADEVSAFSPLDPKGCANCNLVKSIVLGPPQGGGENQGSADIVSLNAKVNNDQGKSGPYGGSITLRFTDNIIYDGPGTDFIVFENAFHLAGTDLYFIEPATVEVSADGERFYRFPFDFVPHYDNLGQLNLLNPLCYAFGFAGVKPVYSNKLSPDPTNAALAGGDRFDLSDLPGKPLKWAKYVRITATGDKWLVDQNGDSVRHPDGAPTFAASGKGNSGFDLDAVTAVNY